MLIREEISSNAQYSEQQDNAEAKQRDHDATKALKLASKVGSVGAVRIARRKIPNPAQLRRPSISVTDLGLGWRGRKLHEVALLRKSLIPREHRDFLPLLSTRRIPTPSNPARERG
jgi:hypothetical protein